MLSIKHNFFISCWLEDLLLIFGGDPFKGEVLSV